MKLQAGSAVLLCVLGAANLCAVIVELPAGRFEKPAAAHREARLPEGAQQVKGNPGDARCWLSPAPRGAGLLLGAGAALQFEFTVPAAPKTELAAQGWYLVFSIDLLGGDGEYAGKLGFSLIEPGRKPKVIAEAQAQTALAAATEKAQPVPFERAWLRLDPVQRAKFEGKTLLLEIAAEAGNLVLDDLRCEMFHEQPSRDLLGKANGVLGPDLVHSGALGLAALAEHLHTGLSLLETRSDGACARAGITRGDLIVALGGRPFMPCSVDAGREWFEQGHEALIGRAVLAAFEDKARKGALTLTVLRAQGPKEIKLKPEAPALLEADMPLNDKAGKLLYADMISWVEKNQGGSGFWPHAKGVNTPLSALALLGTRDRRHRKAIDAAVQALLRENPDPTKMTGLAYWTIAFQGMLFCEYHLATGDARTLKWVREAIEWLPSTTHKCKWGMQAFGHGPDGLPYEDKALMAPCAHLLVFDALARKCGVQSKVWEHLEPYVMHSWSDPEKGGHGGMGYNASAKDTEEFWSRTGLVALALHLRDDNPRMKDALTAIMAERHPWMLNSHAYGEPGAALGLIALAVAAPERFKKVMPQWRWRFVSAWQPGLGLRYSTPHMGSPYMGEEDIINPAYALLWSVAGKGLVMTGGEPKKWLADARREALPERLPSPAPRDPNAAPHDALPCRGRPCPHVKSQPVE